MDSMYSDTVGKEKHCDDDDDNDKNDATNTAQNCMMRCFDIEGAYAIQVANAKFRDTTGNVNIYIYIERERETDRQTDRARGPDLTELRVD
jgi:hypothetical protein